MKKTLSLLLSIFILFSSVCTLQYKVSASTFVARENEPSTTSQYWRHTSVGGVNSCILISNGSVLPNCVGYAWGRAYEILNSKPDLSCGDAGTWFDYNKSKYDSGNGGYPYSTDITKPKLGAIVCWAQPGQWGHVAVVEKINGNQITTSESGYNSRRFWTTERSTTSSTLGQDASYVFQGYIYITNTTSSNHIEYDYNCHCIIKTKENKNIMNMPCSKETDSKSTVLETTKKSDLNYEAIRLIFNKQKNYWYEVKLKGKSGTGYIYAGNAEWYSHVKNSITGPGITVPANHTQGKPYPLSSSVTTSYNYITKVSAYVYSGTKTSGTSETGAPDTVNGKSYSLSGSSVDNNTVFNGLRVGQYTYVVTASFSYEYAKDGKTKGTKTGSVPVYTKSFNVVSSHSHSYSSHYEADHPHKVYNKCSCGDWHYTGATTSVSSCSQCNPTVPSTIIYPTDGGIYKIASGVGNNMYLDFACTNDNVRIYENCDNHSDPAFVKSQYYRLTHVGDGWYTISNIGNNLAADVATASPESGTNIIQYEHHQGGSQQFRFYDAGDGYCYIKSSLGTYMDVQNGDNVNNTNVWAYSFNGSNAQKWKLLPIEDIISNDESKSINNKHYSNVEKLIFQGWAFSNRGKSVSFSYVLDSNSAVTIPNAGRPDVKQAYSSICAFADVGYVFTIDLSKLSVGKHTIKVIASSFFGTSFAVSDLCFYVDAHSHKFGAYTVTKQATCKEKGTKTFTCSCGNSYTEDININSSNHINTKNVAEVKATCTTKGYTAGVFCNDCQKYISGHTEISVDTNAHKWNNGAITTTATCTVSGVKTYTCQHNSSHKKTENLGVNSSNHINTKNVAEVKATCSAKGYTAGVYCNDCKTYISGHKETAKNTSNHINTRNVAEVPATTESVGYTAGVYCNDCKKYISGHTEIPKLVPEFTDSKEAKKSGSDVLSVNGLTTSQLLSQAGKNTALKTADGKAVENTALIGTGMILTMADGKTYTIVVYGDVDGNGTVTAADARLTLRASVGLEKFGEASAQYKAANVESKDKVTAADARLILRASVGLEDAKKWMK